MKTKRPFDGAVKAANELMRLLEPACQRIEIAGSIRRECAYVGDIEIVAIPRYGSVEVDLFGSTETFSELDLRLADVGVRFAKNGPKYKQFAWGDTPNIDGYQIDLFLATPENLGYILMLRTGDAEFSHRMVTPQALGGLKPDSLYLANGYVQTKWPHQVIPVPDEETLFELWGLDYVPPTQRTTKTGSAL